MADEYTERIYNDAVALVGAIKELAEEGLIDKPRLIGIVDRVQSPSILWHLEKVWNLLQKK